MEEKSKNKWMIEGRNLTSKLPALPGLGKQVGAGATKNGAASSNL